MDPMFLVELEERLDGDFRHVFSTLIVRNGYLVYEYYRDENEQDQVRTLQSVTKSFISALIGIALEEGHLENLDQSVAELLPRYTPEALDPRVGEITLKQLLSMTSGFRCPRDTCAQNPIERTFAQQMSYAPGESFNYDSASTHLLSAVITEVTGMNTLDFARTHLFQPLGISEVRWYDDNHGYNLGGYGLYLRSRDMAKFGFLYLNNGYWDGDQIIPADYIRQSVQQQTGGGFPEDEPYGYLWWVTSTRDYPSYFAGGYGGQYIYIFPGLDLVVVITSRSDRPHRENRELIEELIVPSVLP
jgi:CubicO group peptidase (beta-lactamase class C family)